ncbi:hypothetical protein Q8A67_006354 [Cirrhinus molitorella]|uniref:BESS domain-containing protein n=1 Tax=Cirrhinus molitorella TaxID=172907 RepID=A0AA88Q908_9TELE|nr:hypothetical protein Q8A67_006354 [Cirrhinus molitorella]
MAFQVRIRINRNRVDVLSVASSSHEFEQFTIGELKKKALRMFPGVDDPTRLKVIFGQDELEDYQTFESCSIQHLSVLVILLRFPGGGGPPKSTGNESVGKVTETAGLLGASLAIDEELHNLSSFAQSRAEQGKIQESDSASQYKGATKPHSGTDLYDFSKKRSDSSDVSVRVRREEKKGKEKYDQPPAEASSVQPDADLQFLQSLLPALKRMDLRRREFAKASIQQLVFEIEFNRSYVKPSEMMKLAL